MIHLISLVITSFTTLGLPLPRLPVPHTHTPQDARTLQYHLTTTRTALKQADVRIAILEERILSLQQV